MKPDDCHPIPRSIPDYWNVYPLRIRDRLYAEHVQCYPVEQITNDSYGIEDDMGEYTDFTSEEEVEEEREVVSTDTELK